MIHPTPPGMLDGLSTPLKSLTALVAALELRKGLLPNCGFILIVCRAGCVQWAEEIRLHFKLVSRSPSTTTFR